MTGTIIVTGMGMETGQICTSPYLMEKLKYSLYSYLVDVGILHQNRDEFRLYPREPIYLPSICLIL